MVQKQQKKRTAKTSAVVVTHKHKNRDVPIPSISREKFFDALEKATTKSNKKSEE